MDCNDFKVLNEIYKGLHMGMNSITNIMERIKDLDFRNEVKKEYEDYNNLAIEVEDILTKYNACIEELPTKDKVIGWTSVKINTMIDDTTSHISEMLMQGTLMGIIEGVKLSNRFNDLDSETENIINKFVKLSEDNIQVLKKYL